MKRRSILWMVVIISSSLSLADPEYSADYVSKGDLSLVGISNEDNRDRSYSEEILLNEYHVSHSLVSRSLYSHVLYDTGERVLNASDAEYLSNLPQTKLDAQLIVVIGYTDYTGHPVSNAILAKERALTVKFKLSDQFQGATIKTLSSTFWSGGQNRAKRADIFFFGVKE